VEKISDIKTVWLFVFSQHFFADRVITTQGEEILLLIVE